MRNAMPMQWIEQAEARQVLAEALFERASRRGGRRGVAMASSDAIMARSGIPDRVADFGRAVRVDPPGWSSPIAAAAMIEQFQNT